jgi:hypothetical protein
MKTLLSLLTASLIGFSAMPAQACQFGVYDETPSSETRTIRHRAGFTFDVPVNYRAELTRNGGVDLLDPDSAQMVDCIRRRNIAMGGWGIVSVSHSPAVVRGPLWPYDVPHLPDNARFIYFEDGSAMISWYSDYDSATVSWYFENLPNGRGSVKVDFINSVDHHADIFNTVERSLAFE